MAKVVAKGSKTRRASFFSQMGELHLGSGSLKFEALIDMTKYWDQNLQ